jgi:hypothetical protein
MTSSVGWEINPKPFLGIPEDNPHSFAGQGCYWSPPLLMTSWMGKQGSCQGRAGREFLHELTHKIIFTDRETEMSSRSRKIMFLGSIVQPVHKADNPTAICEAIV